MTNFGLWAMFLFAGAAILHVFDDDPAPVGIALEYLHVVVAVVLSNATTVAGATRISL